MTKIKKTDAFNDPTIKVPFVLPEITNEDKNSVVRALSAALLTDGPQLRKFENAFSKFTGTKYAVGVSNATAALQLSIKALGIGKGDEVIVPDMTFVATANAVISCGAIPVLADVEKETMNISLDSIKNNLTAKTKAILPVHFAGRICNMNGIKKIAKHNGLMLIEDCAHAIGAKFNNKHAGTFGEAGCFSFYPTKNFTTIEGGMVITNSKPIAKFVRESRNHGITKTLDDRFSHGKPWDYDINEPGYNYRLDEIRSSLGLNQIKRIKKIHLLRKRACNYYNSKLKKIKGISTPNFPHVSSNAFHLYIIRLTDKFPISRDELFSKLLQNGIRTSVHYKPLHKFTGIKKYVKCYDKLVNSESLYNEIISLPLYPNISKKEQDYVIKNILN